MFCNHCGAEIKMGSKYCAKCGKECVDSKKVQNTDNKSSIFRARKGLSGGMNTATEQEKKFFSLNLGDGLKKKKTWFILFAGIGMAFFLGINLLIYMSKQGLYFIKKDLPDGKVAKYRMISLNERELYSTTEKNETETIETFYGEYGEIVKKTVEHSSGIREELYYDDGLEYLKKYYNEDKKVSNILFRITPKINEEEDTSYDFVLESIPAVNSPMIDLTVYDGKEEWKEFIYDEVENIVKYFPRSEEPASYYKYEYYNTGKVKAIYHYEGKDFTQVIRYYESGAISEEEQYNSKGELTAAYEYDESGQVLKTTEITWEQDNKGYGTICYADGTTQEVIYQGDKLSSCYTYDANGKIIKEWEDYDEEVRETEYYPDLEVRKVTIYYDKAGNEIGRGGEGSLEEIENNMKKWSWYDQNGILQEEKILDNIGNIKNEYRYSDGVLRVEEAFDNLGNMESQFLYYDDGKVEEETRYVDDNISYTKRYDRNGVLKEEKTIENGIGKYTTYREDGTKEEYIEREVSSMGTVGSLYKRIQYKSDGSYVVETFLHDTGYYDEIIRYNADGTIKEREIYRYAKEGDFEALAYHYVQINRAVTCTNYVDHNPGMIDYHYDGEGNLFLIETHENTSVNAFMGGIHRAYIPE